MALLLSVWSAITVATCVESRRLGALLAVGLFLPPVHAGEVFGYMINIQWILAPTLALFLLTSSSPNHFVFAALAGLTGPFSIFLAPIAA